VTVRGIFAVVLCLAVLAAGCDLANRPAASPVPNSRPGCDCFIQVRGLADPATAQPGDAVEIILSLTNRGPCAYAEAVVVAPVVTGTTYIADTVTGGATFDSKNQNIRWEDRFLTQAHAISYQVRIEPAARAGPLVIPVSVDPSCQHQDPFTATVSITVTAR
jgi:uncharacterized repeat protein (TIGR01451 family)